MAGEGDPRLDRAHAASAQLAVALLEWIAVLGEPPGDPHQRVAALAGGLAGDRPRFADRRRFIASRRQAGVGVEALGGGEALDRQSMSRKGRGAGGGDPRQRPQNLTRRLGQESGDLFLERVDVGFQCPPALDVATQALGPQLGVWRGRQAAAPAFGPKAGGGAREPPGCPGDQRPRRRCPAGESTAQASTAWPVGVSRPSALP